MFTRHIKNLFLLFVFSLVICYACKGGEKPTLHNNDNKKTLSENIIDTDLKVHSSEIDILITSPPYPEAIHGIWGNMRYKESLNQYKSVGKSIEVMKFDTDIKINRDMILVMRPQYFDPWNFDTLKYQIFHRNKDSLYIKSKSTGEKQLYLKMMSLPDNNLWSLGGEEYSSISLIQWEWFKGKYNCHSKNDNDLKTIEFLQDGTINGLKYNYYDFGIDVDGKDYIWFGRNNGEHAYFLIEYQPDDIYECYSIEEFEDWEEPFVKKELVYQLKKVK